MPDILTSTATAISRCHHFAAVLGHTSMLKYNCRSYPIKYSWLAIVCDFAIAPYPLIEIKFVSF